MVPSTQPPGESPSGTRLGWPGPASHARLSRPAGAGHSPRLLPPRQSDFAEVLGGLSGIKSGLKFKGFGSLVQGGFAFGTEAIERGALSTPGGRKLMQLLSLIFAFES